MKKAEDIRLENARELAKLAGSNAAFADRINRSPTQVSRFLGKGATTAIGPKMARHIEHCFLKPSGWLDQSHNRDEIKEDSDKNYFRNQVMMVKKIPLVSKLQAGSWTETVNAIELGDDVRMIDVPADISDDALAFEVSGNSMTNPYGAPSLPNGSIVIVYPCECPPSGKIVAATLNDSPEATIKKLEIDGPNKFLVPLNPKYDPIKIDENCRILGYVKRVLMYLD